MAETNNKMEYTSIDEALQDLGIKKELFEKVYTSFKVENSLIPPTQYSKIVEYLKSEGVLDKDCKIDADGFKVYDTKKSLEEAAKLVARQYEKSDFRGSGGGVLPCVRNSRVSSGGIAPCSSYDDDDD